MKQNIKITPKWLPELTTINTVTCSLH